MERVLFICKERDISYFGGDSPKTSSGLFNSCKALVEMINKHDLAIAKLAKVIDNNDIDREVHKFKPTKVFIEALWVVPEKFEILTRLHPKVHWFIRLHSEIPFLANEGVAVDWIFKYLKIKNVNVGFNSLFAYDDFKQILGGNKVYFLPNFYPAFNFGYRGHLIKKGHVNIGCFGAIRPFKNHLLQAVAAMQFAEDHDLQLNFYVNSTRVELDKQGSIIKNLRALFKNHPVHKLIEIDWLRHDDFIKLLAHDIDIGMQVSLSETFNIVTADMVNCGIPVVTSPEVYWVHPIYHAEATNGDSISEKLDIAYKSVYSGAHVINIKLLDADGKNSIKTWEKFLRPKSEPKCEKKSFWKFLK